MGSRPDFVRENVYDQFLNNSPNNQEEIYRRLYFRALSEIAINRFEWHNLPDTVDVRFLEWRLFTDAVVGFYFDDDFSRFMAAKVTATGPTNIYDNPTDFTVWRGSALQSLRLNSKEIVPIWANYMRVPDVDIVSMYAHRLAQAARTVDIDILNERHPFIVTVPMNQRLTMLNAIRQVEAGEPIVYGNEELNMTGEDSAVNAFNTGLHPNATLNAMSVFTRLWNECMMLLGINGANTDKRERMIVDEINANDEQVESTRNVALNARTEAAERIRDMFGLDVHVTWNESGANATVSDRGVSSEQDMSAINGEAE